MGGPHVIKKRGKQEEENFKILFRDYFVSMCVFANRYLEDGEMARDVVWTMGKSIGTGGCCQREKLSLY